MRVVVRRDWEGVGGEEEHGRIKICGEDGGSAEYYFQHIVERSATGALEKEVVRPFVNSGFKYCLSGLVILGSDREYRISTLEEVLATTARILFTEMELDCKLKISGLSLFEKQMNDAFHADGTEIEIMSLESIKEVVSKLKSRLQNENRNEQRIFTLVVNNGELKYKFRIFEIADSEDGQAVEYNLKAFRACISKLWKAQGDKTQIDIPFSASKLSLLLRPWLLGRPGGILLALAKSNSYQTLRLANRVQGLITPKPDTELSKNLNLLAKLLKNRESELNIALESVEEPSPNHPLKIELAAIKQKQLNLMTKLVSEGINLESTSAVSHVLLKTTLKDTENEASSSKLSTKPQYFFSDRLHTEKTSSRLEQSSKTLLEDSKVPWPGTSVDKIKYLKRDYLQIKTTPSIGFQEGINLSKLTRKFDQTLLETKPSKAIRINVVRDEPTKESSLAHLIRPKRLDNSDDDLSASVFDPLPMVKSIKMKEKSSTKFKKPQEQSVFVVRNADTLFPNIRLSTKESAMTEERSRGSSQDFHQELPHLASTSKKNLIPRQKAEYFAMSALPRGSLLSNKSHSKEIKSQSKSHLPEGQHKDLLKSHVYISQKQIGHQHPLLNKFVHLKALTKNKSQHQLNLQENRPEKVEDANHKADLS